MDDNDKSVTYGVSHRDGISLVKIGFDGNRKMLLDFTTTIQFNPSKDASAPYGLKLAKATSIDDDVTIRPWVVNDSTGAVLASRT